MILWYVDESGVTKEERDLVIGGYCVHDGRLTEAVDMFDQPFWDYIRTKASKKALEIRSQGFYGPSMAPMDEMEYTGVMDNLKRLDAMFVKRSDKPTA